MKNLLIHSNLYALYVRKPPELDSHVVMSLSSVGREEEKQQERLAIAFVDCR